MQNDKEYFDVKNKSILILLLQRTSQASCFQNAIYHFIAGCLSFA